nr:TonB-dependent receptor [uncultured Marinifilum sp.]
MVKHIFTLLLLIISLSSYCQNINLQQEIKLQKSNFLLSELLDEITKQSNAQFSFTSELNTNKYIQLDDSVATIKSILNRSVNNKSFKIQSKGNKIFIVSIPPNKRKYRISGYISDEESGEILINATIANVNNFTGTVSNNFGFYSLSLKNNTHLLQFSFVGYEEVLLDIELERDTSINIALKPKTVLQEVQVTANNKANNINHLFVSSNSIQGKNMKQTGVFGENDLFQNLLHLPGVQNSNEGLGGLNIRNGSSDQNLILLDDVPVYYSSHLMGLYSVFNQDAIKQVKIVKGGFPAHYGGRVSSVLDIRMKDGNTKKLKGSYSLGLLTAKFNLNGPIKKEKTTFNLSIRRTYLDLLVNGILEMADSDVKAGYYFGDLNWKIVHRFSQRDKLYFSSYWGGDLAKVKNTEDISSNIREKTRNKLGWGNFTNSLRWNHVYNNHLFGNTSLILSKYTFLLKNKRSEKTDVSDYKENYNYEFKSGIRDFSFKTEFDFIPDYKHYMKFGLEASLHHTKPGSESLKNTELNNTDITNNQLIKSKEINLFGECQIRFGKKLLVNMGTRWSSFIVENTYYSTLEPRLNSQYFINPKWSITGSFSQMTQYLHLLRTSSLSLPTDLWFPVTKKIKPIDSFQYTGGTHYTFNKSIKLSIEFYHKLNRNLLDLKETSYFQNITDDWENLVESGKGWSKGMEIGLSKNQGKTNGNISYTLSQSRVKYNGINGGKSYASPYDRRHNFSIQINQFVNKKIKCSAYWTYGTGVPATLSTSYITTFSPYNPNLSQIKPTFSERNSYRLPDYHRLDFSISFTKKKKHGIRSWDISIYNFYNRKNTSYMYVSSKNSSNKAYQLKKVNLFSFIPSISYSYKF